MAITGKTRLFSTLGFVVWGDLGPLTMYRRRGGKIVFFPRTYPDKQPSYHQALIRSSFSSACVAWNQLPKTTQALWQRAVTVLSLPITGYNLFLHWKLQADDSYVRTIQRQSGITLLA